MILVSGIFWFIIRSFTKVVIFLFPVFGREAVFWVLVWSSFWTVILMAIREWIVWIWGSIWTCCFWVIIGSYLLGFRFILDTFGPFIIGFTFPFWFWTHKRSLVFRFRLVWSSFTDWGFTVDWMRLFIVFIDWVRRFVCFWIGFRWWVVVTVFNRLTFVRIWILFICMFFKGSKVQRVFGRVWYWVIFGSLFMIWVCLILMRILFIFYLFIV